MARHSWNKAFDLVHIPDPQLHFEYPLIPLSMSSSLAALLEKHPSLPLQGASGLLATVSQVFQDYGVQVEDYGKGSSKGALRDKGSDSPKKKGKSKGVKPWSNWHPIGKTVRQINPSGSGEGMMIIKIDPRAPPGLPNLAAHGRTGVPARQERAAPLQKAARVVADHGISCCVKSVFALWV